MVSFRATNTQKHKVTLTWSPPIEANGVLIGYILQYQLSTWTSLFHFLHNPRHKNPKRAAKATQRDTSKQLFSCLVYDMARGTGTLRDIILCSYIKTYNANAVRGFRVIQSHGPDYVLWRRVPRDADVWKHQSVLLWLTHYVERFLNPTTRRYCCAIFYKGGSSLPFIRDSWIELWRNSVKHSCMVYLLNDLWKTITLSCLSCLT